MSSSRFFTAGPPDPRIPLGDTLNVDYGLAVDDNTLDSQLETARPLLIMSGPISNVGLLNSDNATTIEPLNWPDVTLFPRRATYEVTVQLNYTDVTNSPTVVYPYVGGLVLNRPLAEVVVDGSELPSNVSLAGLIDSSVSVVQRPQLRILNFNPADTATAKITYRMINALLGTAVPS